MGIGNIGRDNSDIAVKNVIFLSETLFFIAKLN